MIRRVKLGASALVLEPWSLGKRKADRPKETWSPFEGARNIERRPFSKWTVMRMRRANRHLNAAALNTLGIVPTDHVLEIGYGSGDALAKAAKMARNGFVAGIDRSLEMLEFGWKRARGGRNQNVSVLRGDVSWLPYSPCSFDKVLCVDGITEWPCTRSGLEEAFRVLRPGGVLVLAERVSANFTKAKAMALAHLLAVVGFGQMEVQLQSQGKSELLLLLAIRP